MKRAFVFAAVLPAVLCFSSIPVKSEKFRHVENFSTSLFKDADNTTAWWDETAGEIKLYPNPPTIVGSYNTSGSMRGVELYGDYLFAADGTAGVHVIDITDPEVPAWVATYNTPGDAWRLAADGNYLYVADGSSGLQVLDISNPAAPTLEGSYNTPGTAYGIEISGTHAFIADAAFGLQVINISNPAIPTLAGSYNTLGESNGVAIWGDYALVADGSRGLQVFNVINPATPTLIATHDTPGSAQDVSVDGDLAYIGDHSYGIRIVDIGSPASPVLLSTCDTPGIARSVAVSGDQAYVADYGSGVQIIDVGDPSNPSLSATLDTPDYAMEIVVAGDRAFVADNNSGLQVMAVRDPYGPSLVRDAVPPDACDDIEVSGQYAYVCNQEYGLRVYDVTDLSADAPALLGTCDTENAYSVAISGKHAFVGDVTGGLKVIDITNPTNPHVIGALPTASMIWGVAVTGNYAWLAAGTGGLFVVDISDPEEPSLIASLDFPDNAYGVAVAGDYAYVVGSFGLKVVNVSNPAAPVLAGDYSLLIFSLDICLRGQIAYIADTSAGLIAMDISDPANPVMTGRYYNGVRGLDVVGDYAYLASGTDGLEIVDVSDPENLALVASYDTPGTAQKVNVSGELVFLADSTAGWHVIKVMERRYVYDRHRNTGLSIALDGSDNTIYSARLTTAQTTGVSWELSSDGGSNWQNVSPDGNWNMIGTPGSDIRWRSTHDQDDPGANPTATLLDLEWLVDNAVIDSIADLPADQGGWVRLRFMRSVWDIENSPSPITGYGIWRRVDDPVLVSAMKAEGSSAALAAAETGVVEKSPVGAGSDESGLPVILFEERTFASSDADRAVLADFPQGTWEMVMSVPAVQQDAYLTSVPTMADSGPSGVCNSVFMLTTHTLVPYTWYSSEPDSGYSIDNIAPGVPLGLVAAYNTGSGNRLSWNPAPEEDFQYFRIYRGSEESFVPDPSTLVGQTAAIEWNDPEYDGWNVYYKMTAVDHAGNESLPASPGSVTEADSPAVPKVSALFQNVPNPFNPSTTIEFSLSRPERVSIAVIDACGRVVRTLVEEIKPAGTYEVEWDGTTGSGHSLASGVYFCRMEAGSFLETRRMTLVK